MRTLLSAVALCLPLAAQDPSPIPAPEPEPAAVAVGKAAPAFRLNDETGAVVAVGGATKTWTVVAFFPKAMTGG